MIDLVIIGAGGFGREVHALIKNINQVKPTYNVLGFLDDGIAKGTAIHELEVLGGIDEIKLLGDVAAVLAIGNPKVRESVKNKMPASTYFPNIIHPLAVFLDVERIRIGLGNIICAGSIFTTDILIGSFCIINLSSTIGHDAVLGDFCAIMPGVNISGGAKLMKGVYVGTGAKLIKATTLGSFSTVGAGAVVDTDVASGVTVVGVPAKPMIK